MNELESDIKKFRNTVQALQRQGADLRQETYPHGMPLDTRLLPKLTGVVWKDYRLLRHKAFILNLYNAAKKRRLHCTNLYKTDLDVPYSHRRGAPVNSLSGQNYVLQHVFKNYGKTVLTDNEYLEIFFFIVKETIEDYGYSDIFVETATPHKIEIVFKANNIELSELNSMRNTLNCDGIFIQNAELGKMFVCLYWK